MFDRLWLAPYVLGSAYSFLAACALYWSWTLVQRALLLMSGLVPPILLLAPHVKPVRGLFWIVNTFTGWIR